jgi:putative MATE family efflux protein
LEIGKIYLQIIFAGSLFTMFNFVTTGILLGVGLTRVSMVILAFVNGLNILLNYVFIFGLGPIPAFGVAGAAIGTVVARGLGSVACFRVLRHPDFSICIRLTEGFKPDPALIWQIVQLGGPRALQGLVRNGSRLAIVGIIGFLAAPTRSLAAYNVGMQVRFISTFVGLALMQATMSRVGRNLGAGRPDLAEQSGHHGARLAAFIMTIAAAFFLLFPNQIMGFFSDDADVIDLGRSFFMTVALTEPLMGLAFAYGGALRGGGDSFSPFIFSALSDLVVILGVGYILGVGFNLGIQGIAIGVAAGVITQAIPCWFQFIRGQWKKNRLA